MKKLIEELETKRDSYNRNADYTTGIIQGLNIAINIVKSHNPWYPVAELPPDGNRINLSIEVIVKNKRNEMTVGHYNYNHSKWECDFEPFIPTHWAYLPEVKP